MKAIVVTDEAAGTAGMTLVERPEPEPAINDVVVQVHASGFTSGELTWPSTWPWAPAIVQAAAAGPRWVISFAHQHLLLPPVRGRMKAESRQ